MKTQSPAAREAARLRAAAWYAQNKQRAAEAARAYREANDVRIKEQKRAAYLRERDDPSFQAKVAAQTEKAKATKPAYDREYRTKNSEKLSQIKAAWRAQNCDLIRAVKASYKARRRAQVGAGDSSKDVQNWLSKTPKICLWCEVSCEDGYHIDHFYPLARGGEHRVLNLAIACPTCNVKKSALMPEEFCARNGLNFSEINSQRLEISKVTEEV